MPLTPFAAEVLSALYEAHSQIDALRQRVAQLEQQQQAIVTDLEDGLPPGWHLVKAPP